MKYVKVNIQNGNEGKLVYPEKYQEEIGNFAVDHLYYDESEGVTKLILLIEDKDFNNSMIRENVEKITEKEVLKISEAKEVRTEKTINETMLRRLEIKSKLGEDFTQEEKDAINPDVEGGAIVKVRILADRISNRKEEEKSKK